MKGTFVILLASAPLTFGAAPDLSKLPPPAKQPGVTYAKDIRPLFEASSCFRCHSGERAKAGLHLDSLEGVLKGSKEGKVIVPGKSQESPLVIAVARLDEEKAMPPKIQPGRGGPGKPGGGGPGQDQPPKPPGQPGGAPGQAPAGGGRPGGMGPPPKPLTAEQVGLVRAWVDQGAK